MSILITIVLGFLAGVIAKFIHPGKEDLGLIMTTLLGVVGSVVAGYGGQMLGLYQAGQGAGFVGSVVGAVVVLFAFSFIKKRAG